MAKPGEKTNNMDNDDSVTLTSEQYVALLERLDELEVAANKSDKSSNKRKPSDDIDRLLDEGRGEDEGDKRQQQPKAKLSVDFDNMTNSQLVNSMMNHMAELLQPYFVQQEELRLYNDIRNLKDDGYDMTQDNLERVLGKMKSRSGLTMQEAYHDVIGKPESKPEKTKDSEKTETDKSDTDSDSPKKSKPSTTDKSEDSPKERRDVLRHLPPIPGEKPGASRGGFEDKEPESLDEAVNKAIEDVAAQFEM